MPISYRKQYADQIEKLVSELQIDTTTHFYGSLKNCLSMINDQEPDTERFIEHVKSRDAYRKQDAFKILPWIKDV